MLMGVTSQIFNSSKAGVVAIALMFLIGLFLFGYAQKRKVNE